MGKIPALVAGVGCWLMATGPASAYYLRLLDTSATPSGSRGPDCEVYDPNLDQLRTWEGNFSNVRALTSVFGLVACTDGGSSSNGPVLVAYDPGDESWHVEDVNSSRINNLINRSGVVAWDRSSSHSGPRAATYDPGLRQWRTVDLNHSFVNNLINSSGVVACTYSNIQTNGPAVAAYDPETHTWVEDDFGHGLVQQLVSSDGVVACAKGGAPRSGPVVAVYDPGVREWRDRDVNLPFIGSLITTGGIVACTTSGDTRNGPVVAAYDAASHAWVVNDLPYSDVADLEIRNGTVHFTEHGAARSFSAARAPRAYFAADTVEGDVPLYVQFVDNSVGTISNYAWSFGDGGGSRQRSPAHTFTTPATYTVQFQVSGPGGSHTASLTIKADITGPSGALLINGGAAATSTLAVNLALTATDNSGSVTSMRFRNEGGGWVAWEPYATSKAWGLIPGEGPKTVYAQFRDPSENVSPTYATSITYDATPPVDGTVAADAGDGEVALSWFGFIDITTSVEAYRLVYGTGTPPTSMSEGTELYHGPATNYTHTGLSNGTVYYYRLGAVDAAGNESSGVATFATPALDPNGDVDGDGLPNGWELAYFGSISNAVASADSDHDGPTNYEEYIAGTVPTDPASYLALGSAAPAPGAVALSWPSVAGRIYGLERSTDPAGAYAGIGGSMPATPPMNTHTQAVSGAAFEAYRVTVSWPGAP